MLFKKGHIPWNKGKYVDNNWNGRKHTIESKEKMSKTRIKLFKEGKLQLSSTIFYKGHIPWIKGKHHSKEIKDGISKNKIGKTTWNKGKNLSDEHKKNISIANVGKKLTKEHIKKALGRRYRSSLELKFEQIISKLNLPYKFVGNGKFFIERKNPDFVNTNGEKIAVEVFYRRHKEYFSGGVKKWMENRRKIFNEYGWKIEYFNEVEVNKIEILKRLG